jgi:hypothetical protein
VAEYWLSEDLRGRSPRSRLLARVALSSSTSGLPVIRPVRIAWVLQADSRCYSAPFSGVLCRASLPTVVQSDALFLSDHGDGWRLDFS